MRNVLCGLVMLAAASTSSTAWAQAERQQAETEKDGEASSRDERIRVLMEQVREIQRELARERAVGTAGFGAGLGAGPGTIGPGIYGPGADGSRLDPPARRGAARGTPQRAQQRLADLQWLIEAQQNKLEVLTRLHGDESEQVRKAREELDEMQAQLDESRAQPRYGRQAALAGPLAGDPAATVADLYRKEMMPAGTFSGGPMAGMPAGFDPAEMGQQMVIRGLEFQLEAQAAEIRRTEDQDTKAEMTEDLRKMVEQVVEARRTHTERQIERLKQRLEELNEQADNPESADDMLKRLLDPKREKRQARPQAEQQQNQEAAEEPSQDQDDAPEEPIEEPQDPLGGAPRRDGKPVESF